MLIHMAKRGEVRRVKWDRVAALERLDELMVEHNCEWSIERLCLHYVEELPSHSVIYGWLEDDQCNQLFTRIQERWCRAKVSEILSISDDTSRDLQPFKRFNRHGDIVEQGTKSDNTAVNRDALRVKARQWAVAKLMPKIFGEKIEQQITGKEGAALQVVINVNTKKPKELPEPE
jgi:hypothetical protein